MFFRSWVVEWHDKTRGAVEGSERGMSATGSELMNAIRGQLKREFQFGQQCFVDNYGF